MVGLEYVRLAVVVPVHIVGLAPKVIAGGAVAFKVTVIGVRVLKQPVVLFVSVTFPLYVPALAETGTVNGTAEPERV